jgi:hypothetical protein
MTAGPFSLAWQDGRQVKAEAQRRKQRRQALLLSFVAFLGRKLPKWKKVRSVTLQVVGLGFLDFAAWQWSVIAGCVAIGLSVLVYEQWGGEQ